VKIGVFILIAVSADSCIGCNPIEPSVQEPGIEQECELILTHPIRQTYAKKCTDKNTGKITITDN
jgi:hypothetical protein